MVRLMTSNATVAPWKASSKNSNYVSQFLDVFRCFGQHVSDLSTNWSQKVSSFVHPEVLKQEEKNSDSAVVGDWTFDTAS